MTSFTGGTTDDSFTGGPDPDTATGGGGNDILRGAGGDDELHGDGQDDYLYGEDGNDTLYGGSGKDHIFGGIGNDIIFGDDNPSAPPGNSSAIQDEIDGGDGNDIITGGNDNSLINGGAGNDIIVAGGVLNEIDGGDGNDVIHALGTAHGGAGNDVIESGNRFGGDGDDLLIASNDQPNSRPTLSGEDGNDRLYFGYHFQSSPTFGVPHAIGGAGVDALILQGDYVGSNGLGYGLYDGIVTDIEILRLLSAADNSYNLANPAANYHYVFALDDSVVETGETFLVDASELRAAEFVKFDGSAETSGTLDLRGGAGNDVLIGGGGNDNLTSGMGTDAISGGAGRDGIYVGSWLEYSDVVDGGADSDTLALQGDYAAGIFLSNVMNVEVIALLSGSDPRFGDIAGNAYDYVVVPTESNVPAGQMMTVIATGLLPGEDLTFNGFHENDGGFRIFTGRGTDNLTGGGGTDGFFFGAEGNFTAADRVDGLAGTDSIALRGNYVGGGALVLQDATLTQVEVLALLSGHNNEFTGTIVPEGFDYDVTLANGNVAAGATLDVNAARLGADETLRFDGRAESDGSFRIISGAAADTLYGGGQNDVIYGGLGADRMEGGSGADIYQYRSAAESTSTGYDQIAGFDWHVDRIDIAGPANRSFSQSAQGSLSTASFDADLAAGMNGVLGANQAALFTANAGTLSGHVFAVIDVNGQAGYQSGQDLVIELVAPVLPIDPGAGVII
jgi:Ca2+-binding RTX toxin-like protein